MSVENFYILLRRHHPPSHCCFFRWHHWFGSNTLLLCGASTKQARLPQQARAGEAVGYLSNEPSSFVDFLGLVSNIIIEGSANPVPHSAQRCGSSCCGSVYRWWASISSMGKKAGKLKLPLPFASVAPGIRRRMGRRIGGPPDLRDWQPWMNQTKDPKPCAGGPGACQRLASALARHCLTLGPLVKGKATRTMSKCASIKVASCRSASDRLRMSAKRFLQSCGFRQPPAPSVPPCAESPGRSSLSAGQEVDAWIDELATDIDGVAQ